MSIVSGCRGEMLSRSAGMRLLLDAWDCALEIGQDVWQLAVEIDVLRRAGLSNSDLRWLLASGFLVHGEEVTRIAERRRRFSKRSSLTLGNRDCLILTPAGRAFATTDLHRPGDAVAVIASRPRSLAAASNGECTLLEEPTTAARGRADCDPEIPDWDGHLHDLWFRGSVIKRFVRPAPAQELILSVLQEEGWPPGVEDPLSPISSSQDPKRRLHYTVQNLNRGQSPPSLHFYVNGHGQLVRWKVISPVGTNRSAR